MRQQRRSRIHVQAVQTGAEATVEGLAAEMAVEETGVGLAEDVEAPVATVVKAVREAMVSCD